MPKLAKVTQAQFDALFVAEYLKDLNARQAVRRAGAQGNDDALDMRAHRMMQRPEILEALSAAQAERLRAANIDGKEVLRHVIAAATVDPNEIMEIRRGCCRHCHGIGFKYQYSNQRDLDRAREAFDDTSAALVESFEHGGLGFDPKQRPHPDCPECGGEGAAYVHVKDTRDLSPAARSLYAGAKQTKDGIEVKLHSQDKNRELLMRHLGMLNDKLVITGDLGEKILRARKRAGG